MLEKLIIRLEQLQARLYHHGQRKRHQRSVRCAKTESNRLAKLRLL